jgi:hypothetical protein
MKKISKKELSQLADIIRQVEIEKTTKQLHRKIKDVSVFVVKPLSRSNSAAQEHGFSPAVMIITPTNSQLWSLVQDSIEMKESAHTRYLFS